MKIGTKVKVKSLEQLRKLTNIGFQKQVTLKNGLIFGSPMMMYAGQEGVITAIAKPGKDNQLTSDSYKVGEVDLYWSAELLEVVK
jgi:hypothetical protein